MKLLSCYIAGFGKFHDVSFDLSKPIIQIKEGNGWGKTTLADFIKCMLYGLEGGRLRSIAENDRVKYTPWTGNVFGGVLTFVYEGRKYRLERKFGKTSVGDEARLYDENNMPCYTFGEKSNVIGEKIFNVDGESFQKTVYIPQSKIDVGQLPDTLKNRLSALMSVAVSANATGGVERLESLERTLRAKRKPNKGKLDEIDERLDEIFRKKLECESYLKTTNAISKELESVEHSLQALQAEKQVESIPLSKKARIVKACTIATGLLCLVVGGFLISISKGLAFGLLGIGVASFLGGGFIRPKKVEISKGEKNNVEKEKEALFYRKAEILLQIDECKKKADDSQLVYEENYLTEEKQRLEKKLQAIKLAKELLIKAKENLATRYLQPVEQKCQEYMQMLGAGMRSMSYSADGNAWINESGSTRQKEYYSAGEKGLLDFCTRVALVDTLFEKELPPLILDDPFVDFDDEKTELVKGLLIRLSKRYQILYFTCKKERML